MEKKNLDLNWSNMLAGIEAQVDFIQKAPEKMYQEIKDYLTLDHIPSNIYLIGCGDSFHCCLAAKLAFEVWAGIHTEAIEALEFSRYYYETASSDSLVVAISNSGRVSRTIEAVLRAREKGMPLIVCTGELDSPIARKGTYVLDLLYKEKSFAPGTLSYVASLMILYCLALVFSELNDHMTGEEIEKKLNALKSLSDGVQKTIHTNAEKLMELARQVNLSDRMVFIGGGPNYGTAIFSRVKIIEATRIQCFAQELEEWAHIDFFITDSNTYTFFILPPGKGLDRGREQLWAANEMGSFTIVFCSENDYETSVKADLAIPVFGSNDEILSPIVYCIPAELLAYYLGVIHQTTMFGFDDPHVREVNTKQIFNSKII